MSDPINVSVPSNAAEAHELGTRLGALNKELSEFIDSNEASWNDECEQKFSAMQADEAAMSAAGDKYISNAAAAKARRDSLGNSGDTFRALAKLQGGSNQKLQRVVDSAVESLSSHALDDVAAHAAIAAFAGAVVSEEQIEAYKEAEARAHVDGRGREWSRGGLQSSGRIEIVMNQVSDAAIRLAQAAARNNRNFQNVLTVVNPSSANTGSGSELFGPTFMNTLEEARLAYGGMNVVSDIMTTKSGERMMWPTIDDSANSGALVAESGTPTLVDPTFGEVQWTAYKYSSGEIKVTRELIEDNTVNLVSRIAGLLGTRLGRLENSVFTNADGTNKPTGLMSVVPTGVTAAGTAAILFDEIIDLEHSVDPARRGEGCSYMMNDSTLKLLRKLKDSDGRYLWQAEANAGTPGTLNGYGYTINQDMASAAVSAKPITFGQHKAFKIRRVNGLRLVVTDELYARTDEIGFFAWVRIDSNLLDAGDNPVTCLTMAAA